MKRGMKTMLLIWAVLLGIAAVFVVVGIWDGLPVIGYDELGYPQTSAFE